MKAILLTLGFAASFLSAACSQTISNVPLKELEAEYILIYGGGWAQKKLAIHIDFGQEKVPSDSNNDLLLNEDKKPMRFNSFIESFNFLAKYGYELVETYVVPSEMTGYTYYILRKKKE